MLMRKEHYRIIGFTACLVLGLLLAWSLQDAAREGASGDAGEPPAVSLVEPEARVDHAVIGGPGSLHGQDEPEACPDENAGNLRSGIVRRRPAGVPVLAGALPVPAVSGMPALAVSEAVGRITGQAAASRTVRWKDLSALTPERLSSRELSRLLDYLEDSDRLRGMSDSAFHVFINDLVALFHDRESLDDRYLEVSRELIRNTSEDEVIRDYVLQGLSRGYGKASPEQAESIRSVFWEALNEVNTSLGGTALHALERIRSGGGLPPGEADALRASLEALLEAGEVDERVRIPAMQAAAAMKLPHLFPALERILGSPSTTRSEKVAALRALAEIDPLRARSFIEEAARSEDPLLASAAAKQFNKRGPNR